MASSVVFSIDNTGGDAKTDWPVTINLSDADAVEEQILNEAGTDGNTLRFLVGGSAVRHFVRGWKDTTGRIGVEIPSIGAGATVELTCQWGGFAQVGASDPTIYDFARVNGDDDRLPTSNGSFITTVTADGDDEPLHPSVLDFGTGKWNGYRYWAAATPYGTSGTGTINPQIENPHIWAFDSKDATTWTVPVGLTNPLDAWPGAANSGNSDTELVYDSGTNKLVCFYREFRSSGERDWNYRTSSNGVTWSAEVTLFTTTADQLLSPSMAYDGTNWHMWWIGGPLSTDRKLMHMTSASLLSGWTHGGAADTGYQVTGWTNWHPKVRYDSTSGDFLMVIASQNDSALRCSLFWSTSTNGTTWNDTGAFAVPVMMAGDYGWGYWGLYRTDFFYDDTTGSLDLYISTVGDCHLAHVETTRAAFETETDRFYFPSAGTKGKFEKSTTRTNAWDNSLSISQESSGTWGGTSYVYADLATPAPTGRILEADWFDDNSSDTSTLGLLRMQGIIDDTSETAGFGVWTGTSTTKLSRHSGGYSYTATTLDRASEWKRLGISVQASNAIEFLVDGVSVATNTNGPTQIERVWIIADQSAGVHYYDDIIIRKYDGVDPVVTSGTDITVIQSGRSRDRSRTR